MPTDDIVQGVSPGALTEEALLRELASLHGTRHDALRHGPDSALANHTRRTTELEGEYLRRHPSREINPARIR
ncbi:hypothetical protein GCM10009827_039210 [Dactylosporangium maewongense]|uniref:Uncharacterized protein n=1 Tax=Dactylosporangium maewongense TaxID=634393 RepID=A0ABN2AI67_9ACTN